MAGLRKIKGGKWKVEIRRKGFPSVNKRFHDVIKKTIKIILQQNLVKNMYRSTTTVRLDD